MHKPILTVKVTVRTVFSIYSVNTFKKIINGLVSNDQTTGGLNGRHALCLRYLVTSIGIEQLLNVGLLAAVSIKLYH